ncbi:MAG: 50S ribosomal protein L4 [Candidatus Wildermuthbacteria bacterium]|nr:50S ribosomal protein L4 [Candidatus Wildermuthbacteria bacterium]
METKVYNQQGAEIETVNLPEGIFGLQWNADLVHQVAVSQMANRRRTIAHTKHRGEVSGGGRKPWAQKGTGRSRQGSTRSPLWRHGGVAFGPRSSEVYSQKVNDKMKRKALLCVLSEKAKQGQVIVLDAISLEQPKTKLLRNIVSRLPLKKESAALVLSSKDESVARAGRNLPSIQVFQAKDLNALDLLNLDSLIILKDGIQVLEKTFGKKS